MLSVCGKHDRLIAWDAKRDDGPFLCPDAAAPAPQKGERPTDPGNHVRAEETQIGVCGMIWDIRVSIL